MPPTAIGKPIAAEVPIALFTGMLHQIKNGTINVPPPMDTRPLTQPANAPVVAMPAMPGNLREARGRTLSKICIAVKHTKKKKDAKHAR